MRLLSTTTFLIAVLVTAASCGGKNPIEPAPPPSQLQLSCPAGTTREATSPQGTDVHFAPTPTGGRTPYNVRCDPGSGTVFAIGETAVRCTATDADMGQASCGFGVTVRVSRTIAKSKFMAFGDSITDGKVSLVPLISLAGPDTYPFRLEQMLRERYATDEVEVSNLGLSGEHLGEGAVRLPLRLNDLNPQVVLILEGVNAGWIRTTSQQASNVRTMITAAQQRRTDVIIATVMPVRAEQFPNRAEWNPRIVALNVRIKQLAAEFDIGPVVDLHSLFEANMNLIGADGLHPTVEGQTRIAEAFRDEIVRRYDVMSSTSLDFSTMRRAR